MPMKRIALTLLAAAVAAAPYVATAGDVAPNAAAARTAALLDSGREIRVNQVDVRVETGDPYYRPYYRHHHHRRYRVVRVVRYVDGVRYVTYRRVYYHYYNG